MKIGFVVNDVATEDFRYTTTHLALAAARLGHEVWMLGVGDFVYAPDGSICAHARAAGGDMSDDSREAREAFLKGLQEDESQSERITLDDLDVLLLRYDPSADGADRPWAQTAGVLFGQLAARRGVIVLNDPNNLANALNKTYFQHFPRQVRPKTCISRNIDEIKEFIAGQEDKVVIKPLQGSGGQSVFVIREDESANLNQMIEAVTRDGYCVAQEYLPAAEEGDVRLFVMNGRPLEHGGKYAAFRRVNQEGDARSNMQAGGKGQAAEVTDNMLKLVELVRPKLARDGMFLVGMDIVEDKVIEINVFSPGGLGSIGQLTGVNFADVIIRDLERKVSYRQCYGRAISNVQIATL